MGQKEYSSLSYPLSRRGGASVLFAFYSVSGRIATKHIRTAVILHGIRIQCNRSVTDKRWLFPGPLFKSKHTSTALRPKLLGAFIRCRIVRFGAGLSKFSGAVRSF